MEVTYSKGGWVREDNFNQQEIVEKIHKRLMAMGTKERREHEPRC